MPSSGTSTSVWMATQNIPDFPKLTKNIEAEICIVGGGIAGITTAYLLAKKGADVVLLEKGRILRGETERTTAHISNAIDDRYTEIERMHGQNGAKLAAEIFTELIDFIEQTIKEENIDCDFRRLDGYLFLGKGEEESSLDKELEAVHRAGLLTVEKLPRIPFDDFNLGSCLRFPKQAQFHPTRYVSALAKAAEKYGTRIFTDSGVETIEEDEQPVRIHVSGGCTVQARTLIVATNAPINDNPAIYGKQAPYRTYVVGMRVPKNSIPHALYWDTEDPYHYIRLAAESDRSDSEILIVGGEDHKTGHADDMGARLKRLEQWARIHFPSVTDVVYTWSGQVFETADGLGLIGRKPFGKPWSFIATGDSGMGMSHGTIAGLLLSDLARGAHHPWENLFDPSRFKFGSTMKILKEGADVAGIVMKDFVRQSEVEKPGDIARGSGAVIRDGKTKIALYRDDEGKFHAHSAICPHKGCIVEWNNGEKSWDCPCHGSRYSATGEVLTGPTIKNLDPLPEWKTDIHA